MTKQSIDEFGSAEDAVMVYSTELESTLKNLQLDLQQIRDPQVRGFAENLYLQYKKEFIKLIETDLTLTKMFEEQEVQDENL